MEELARLKARADAEFKAKRYVSACRQYSDCARQGDTTNGVAQLQSADTAFIKHVSATEPGMVGIVRACHANACLSALRASEASCSSSEVTILLAEIGSQPGAASFEHQDPRHSLHEVAMWHAARSVAWDSKWHRGHLRLSQAALSAGDATLALQSARRALALKPDDVHSKGALAAAQAALAQSEHKASTEKHAPIAQPPAAAREPPRTADGWREEGNRLLRSKDPEASIRAYDRSLELDASDARTHSNRCHALLQLAAAEAPFLRPHGAAGGADTHASASAADSSAPSRAEHARSNRNKRLTSALEAASRAAALRPDWARARLRKGTVLLRLGRIGAAQSEFRKAKQLCAGVMTPEAMRDSGAADRGLQEAGALHGGAPDWVGPTELTQGLQVRAAIDALRTSGGAGAGTSGADQSATSGPLGASTNSSSSSSSTSPAGVSALQSNAPNRSSSEAEVEVDPMAAFLAETDQASRAAEEQARDARRAAAAAASADAEAASSGGAGWDGTDSTGVAGSTAGSATSSSSSSSSGGSSGALTAYMEPGAAVRAAGSAAADLVLAAAQGRREPDEEEDEAKRIVEAWVPKGAAHYVRNLGGSGSEWRNLNPFAALELPLGADDEAVGKRLKSIQTMVHPDRHSTTGLGKLAASAFQAIKAIKEKLADPVKRELSVALVREGRKEGRALVKEEEEKRRTRAIEQQRVRARSSSSAAGLLPGASKSSSSSWKMSEEEKQAMIDSAVARTFARLEHRRRTAESRRATQARDAADDEAAEKAAKDAEAAFQKEWEEGVEARVKQWRQHQDGVKPQAASGRVEPGEEPDGPGPGSKRRRVEVAAAGPGGLLVVGGDDDAEDDVSVLRTVRPSQAAAKAVSSQAGRGIGDNAHGPIGKRRRLA